MRILGLLLGLSAFAPARAAVEFAAYPFDKYSQAITECDRLAAHARDPGSVAPGVSREDMDKPAAVEACLAAVQDDPEHPRLNYQLARALGYSSRGAEAMPYRMKAVAADYPQSLFVIGYLHFIGQIPEADRCQAQQLWLRAAKFQRLAALVALPRHQMRGDFSLCQNLLSKAQLRAYLERAQKSSSDFYIQMLVTDLLSELEGSEKAAF